VTLPEQVRKQSEAVKQLYAQLERGEEGENPTPAADPVVAPAEPADGAVTPVQPAAVEPQPAGALPNDDFEQKYKTLQGMYNNEVPRLHASNKDLQTRLSQTEALLANLSAVPAAPPSLQQHYVTDEDRTSYGDSIDMMRKVAKEELFAMGARLSAMETALNNLSASLNTTVLPQVRHVAQHQAMTAEARFWDDLQRSVPNWQQINNDPGFQSWLLEVDSLTGTDRQTFLADAQKQLNASRVIAFFKAFVDQTGKFGTSTPKVQPSRAASELEQQVAPGRSRGGTPPANPTAKTYTPADIAKFYEDVRKGVYKGRETERNRIEHDIFAARQEGRLVVNA